MKEISIQATAPLELGSSRASVSSPVDRAHFTALLNGMKSATGGAPVIPSDPDSPDKGYGLGGAMIKDVFGLDQIVRGMDVAGKLNENVMDKQGFEMKELTETLLRLEAGGDVFFMQVNYASQKATDLGEEVQSITKGKA